MNEVVEFKPRATPAYALTSVGQAIAAISASRSHDGKHSAASITYTADHVIVTTLYGMGKFTYEEWGQGNTQ